jgi:hypothetical protein
MAVATAEDCVDLGLFADFVSAALVTRAAIEVRRWITVPSQSVLAGGKLLWSSESRTREVRTLHFP